MTTWTKLPRTITAEAGKTLEESKAEMTRAIENVEVACGTPALAKGEVVEDIAPGIDEIMLRQPVGVGATYCAVQLPGDDPVLVSALCNCLRQHFCGEAIGEGPD